MHAEQHWKTYLSSLKLRLLVINTGMPQCGTQECHVGTKWNGTCKKFSEDLDSCDPMPPEFVVCSGFGCCLFYIFFTSHMVDFDVRSLIIIINMVRRSMEMLSAYFLSLLNKVCRTQNTWTIYFNIFCLERCQFPVRSKSFKKVGKKNSLAEVWASCKVAAVPYYESWNF